MKKIYSDVLSFHIVGYTFLFILVIVCVLPFILVLSGSLTPEQHIYEHGYRLWPKEVSFDAYQIILSSPDTIGRAYMVSMGVTFFGTAGSLFISSMTAYVLSRKEFEYRNHFAIMIYFTTIFTGGMVPMYIWMVNFLNLKDNYLAIIMPTFLTAWNILLLRNFIKSIPEEVIESAQMDGAGHFTIYSRIILPLAVPGLVTIGLFISLHYWNDWAQARLFIEDPDMFTLPYLLYNTINRFDALSRTVAGSGIPMPDMPTQSLKLAIAIISIGPMVFLFPILQKFFIKGLTVGAVKG